MESELLRKEVLILNPSTAGLIEMFWSFSLWVAGPGCRDDCYLVYLWSVLFLRAS